MPQLFALYDKFLYERTKQVSSVDKTRVYTIPSNLSFFLYLYT